MEKLRPPRVVSLFSGAGGLDIGFHDAGFQILKAVELEKNYSDIMKLNTGKGLYFGEEVEVLNMDVNDFNTDDVEDIDWIIGGPPCQTFSAAGRRANGVLGLDDPRGVLFERYVEIVKALKPKGFLYENVYGLVGAEKGVPWKLIKEGFREAGYKLFHRILDAADYGAPQHRERLIMVGIREGEFKFPKPTHGPDSADNHPHFSAQEALAGLPGQHWDGSEFGGRWGHLLPDIPPGLNYSFYTAKLEHPNPVFAWRSKFSDFLYKADPDKPVRTIKAQGGKYTGPLHWANRHFTHEELKLLQSFPKAFKLGKSETTNRAVIGNSVPPALARALAFAVKSQIFGFENVKNLEWLDESDELTFRKEKRKRTKYYQEKAKAAHQKGGYVYEFEPMLDDNIRLESEAIDEAIQEKTGGWNVEIKCRSPTNGSKRHHPKKKGHVLDLHMAHSERHGYQGSLTELDEVDAFTVRQFAEIRIIPHEGWDIPPSQINVSMYINTQFLYKFSRFNESLSMAFKAVREVIKMRYRIDDLVQLNGYYQQSNPRIRVEYDMMLQSNQSMWKAATLVAKSDCIGQIVDFSKWCEIFGTSKIMTFNLLRDLKAHGFDVRDHHTNHNIEPGDVLITYPFPTLAKGKVQWEKRLGGMMTDLNLSDFVA